MSMTLQEIRDEVRRAAGINVSQYDDTILDPLIHRSYQELVDKIDFREKEATVELTLVAGTQAYVCADSISSDFDSILHIGIQEYPNDPNNSTFQQVVQKDYSWIMDKRNDSQESQGLPFVYARYGASLYFHPVPDDSYVVEISYRKSLGNVAAGGPSIPYVWHEFVFLGALLRLYYILGDFARSNAVRAERDALILTSSTTKAKETMDYSMAGVSVLRQRYP